MENKNDDSEAENSGAFEVVSANALEATERATVDTQIATAKKYPRSLQSFKKRAVDMATIDEETAESCIYRRPVGKERDPQSGQMVQKFAEGMSVRMAEIVGASYGNLRVKAFIVEQTERYVRACGQAIDLETNFASSSETVESTVDKQGRPYSERQRMLVAKVALSKARRDATFQVVPRALARPVESAVRSLLMGDAETITKRRAKVITWINKLGIDPKRVYAALKIQGEVEIGVEQLETLTGIKTAIRDNETTIDEAFPVEESTVKKPIFTPQPGTEEKGKHPDLEAAKPKPAESPKPVEFTPEQKKAREELINAMQGEMLDANITEKRLFKIACEAGLVEPVGIDELFSMTTEALVKVRALIPTLKK